MTDLIVREGYKDAGYEYVILDDCWMAEQRDSAGRLQPDPKRFGKGIKYLADYMHSRNLKFGIYEDEGDKTCQGLPGSMGHEAIDVETFASWEVDYIKLDGCYATVSQLDKGYPIFGEALSKIKRDIVFSCEWAWWVERKCYQENYPECHRANYTAIRDLCNVERNMDDIGPYWSSLLSTIDYYDNIQDELIATAGPGAWHDPDQLLAGNDGISVDQAKLQMALWAIWSAPLLISTDLRKISKEFKEILQNKAVIAIDQDPLGIMGRMVNKTGPISVYVKPITPVDKATGDRSYAIAFMNRDQEKKVQFIGILEDLGLKHSQGYEVENLFEKGRKIILHPKTSFGTTVNPTGVNFFKFTVVA